MRLFWVYIRLFCHVRQMYPSAVCVCVCQRALIYTHKTRRSVYPVSIGLFWRLFLVETGLFWRLFPDLDFFPVSTCFFVVSEGCMLACVWCRKGHIYILLNCTHTYLIHLHAYNTPCGRMWCRGRCRKVHKLLNYTHTIHSDVGACVVSEVIYITHLHARNTEWWVFVGAFIESEPIYHSLLHLECHVFILKSQSII